MILRYTRTDYQTFKEDEVLMIGSLSEVKKYILANYSVDWLKDSIEEKSEKVADLNCLKIGTSKCPALFSDEVLSEMVHNGKDIVEKCDWSDVIASNYIFNRDVIEIF